MTLIAVYKKDRKCKLKKCRKKLSKYNPNEVCFCHISELRTIKQKNDPFKKIVRNKDSLQYIAKQQFVAMKQFPNHAMGAD